MPKKKLLVAEPRPTSMVYKMLYFLKEYFDITLISLSSANKFCENDYRQIGIDVKCFNFMETRYWKDKKIFAGIKEFYAFFKELIKLKRQNYDFVLVKTEPNYLGYIIFKMFKKSKKIYFPYDITSFKSWKNNRIPKIEKFLEKFCFENVNYIIYKDGMCDLNKLNYNIIGKLILMEPSCFSPWMQPIKKEKNKLKGIHFVYIGNYSPGYKIRETFNSIVVQGIKIHIYPTSSFNEQLSKNIIMHKFLSNKKLNSVMSQYHYGMNVFFCRTKSESDVLRVAVPNKIFSYLEAGIPIIVGDENEWVSSFVKKNKCGIVISKEDVLNLRKILESQDYNKLLKNVCKTRKKLGSCRQMNKLLKEIM